MLPADKVVDELNELLYTTRSSNVFVEVLDGFQFSGWVRGLYFEIEGNHRNKTTFVSKGRIQEKEKGSEIVVEFRMSAIIMGIYLIGLLGLIVLPFYMFITATFEWKLINYSIPAIVWVILFVGIYKVSCLRLEEEIISRCKATII